MTAHRRRYPDRAGGHGIMKTKGITTAAVVIIGALCAAVLLLGLGVS